MRPRAWHVLLAAVTVFLVPTGQDAGKLSLQTAFAQGTGPDRDRDGIPNAADNCLSWPNPDQADADGNGIGNVCECGDQDGNSVVDVRDLIAINLAIFDPARVTPLCDTNGDGLCTVSDIVGANERIFGRPAYCSRHPRPGPADVDGDGDGYAPADGDCNDGSASIRPEPTPIDPNALAPVVAGACEDGPLTPNDCNPGSCFAARGPFRDFRETDGCSNPAAIDPNNPSGPNICPSAAFATGDPAHPRGCDLHDFCYRTCGSVKSECDAQQLKNHLAICNSLPASQSVCIQVCRGWAQTYYEALQNAPAAQEAWTKNQGLYCSCCGGGDCGDGICDPAAGERPRSCPQDCPPAAVGAACVVDGDCASGQCSFSGRCIQCGNGTCEQGEVCGTSPGCRADCGLCTDGEVCRSDSDCQSGFCDLVEGFCRPCQSNGTVCLRDAACCNDVCNNAFLCASCKDNGQACLTDDVCCSNICNNAFQCASCKSNGQGCLTDGVCCSNICNNAFQCASCKSNGQSCLTSGVCCSGLCNGAFVCSTCHTLGGICGADRDCCSGNCNFLGLCGL